MKRADFRVVYICSSSHAGSTLTDMFLGGHSQVASLGEVNFLGKDLSVNALCSCGARLCECQSWRQVFHGLATSNQVDILAKPYSFRLWDAIAVRHIDTRRQTRAFRASVLTHKAWMEFRARLSSVASVRLPVPQVLNSALHNKMALYQTAARAWGRSVLIDSSKNQREAAELYRLWPMQVKVVLLTRDGRGVYLSNRKRGVSQADSLAGWKNYYRRALPGLAKSVSSKDLLMLRYEDLASDPANAGQRLCSFAGLGYEPEMEDLSRVTRHQINGNTTRFAPTKGVSLDERWRTELAPDELDYFNLHGGAVMNRRLGYM